MYRVLLESGRKCQVGKLCMPSLYRIRSHSLNVNIRHSTDSTFNFQKTFKALKFDSLSIQLHSQVVVQ